MSRSYKKPIIQDRPKQQGRTAPYYKRIRRTQRTQLRSQQNLDSLDNLEIENSKSIMNDYDYCDYKFDLRWDKDSKWRQKYSRK